MVEDYVFIDDEFKQQIITMSNTLINKTTKYTVEEQRLFYVTLASILPNQTDNEIEIEKKMLFDLLGFSSKSNYARIRPMFKKLAHSSWIEFGDDEIFDDGFLFTRVRTTKKKIYVTIAEQYMPLLIQLQSRFTRLLLDDAISFKSKYSMLLYQQFMRWNTKEVFGATTKQLKDLFGMTKDDYMDKKNDVFKRYLFEQRTIEIAITEINEKSKCIRNLMCEKKKKGNRVQGYVFTWTYVDPNNIENKQMS